MYRIVGLPCFVTIATKGRERIFCDERLASDFVALVKTLSLEHDVPLYAYCIMPDHAHFLLSASENKGIVDFVAELKGRCTKIARQHGYRGTIWQRSFYDHFLRQDEDCRAVAEYIIHNPVRKGIVEDWRDYSFAGSLIYEL